MSGFIESLKTGKLTTSKCLSCKTLIWPPGNICSKCLSNKIEWVQVSPYGKLLEFSESFIASEPAMYGIVELNDNIRLFGRIIYDNDVELKKGIDVKLFKCGLDKNDDVYYEFQPM
ncbi:MAG: zinc ribbon domain-containing protein [Nitrososphaerales archaeon]